MGIFLTQVFKYIVGRLRPNFLARCQPDVPAGLTFTLQNITSGISDQFPCTGNDVTDGRLAFPSGGQGLGVGGARGGGAGRGAGRAKQGRAVIG